MSEHVLQIRLLGDPAILRAGRPVELPPSKKTRALLVYLVATGRPHTRAALCDLLWDGPDDPRGALRWSLAKLRPLLDCEPVNPLVADRERVAFAAGADIDIDIDPLKTLLGRNIDAASTSTLKDAAAKLHGEFAAGLELSHCPRFHAWCAAERERWSELRLAVLTKLVAALADSPQEALVHARSRVAVDPLNEAGHVEVLRLLARIGHPREALQQFEYCRQLLRAELGVGPSPALERARALLDTTAARSNVEQAHATAAPASPIEPDLFGREPECAALAKIVAATAAASGPAQFVLLTGDPGIGKTRLLHHFGDAIARAGGEVLGARAFEAEIARPHGIWADLVTPLSGRSLPATIRAGLQPLFAEGDDTPDDGDSRRLFSALVALVNELSRHAPVAILIEDLQWIDDASVALLHYVMRALDGPCRVVIAATARPGELADNVIAQRLLHGRALAGSLVELALAPLDARASAALARTVAPDRNIASVGAASEGNPLFTLELARSVAAGSATMPASIDAALAELLARVAGPARTVLPWAAALGRVFELGVLARCVRLGAQEWLDAFEELERRGIVRGIGADRYDFVHDLIRAAAYGQISQPRRRLIHGQIAQALGAALALACTDDLMLEIEKMGEGGEPPFVRTLAALARVRLREQEAHAGLDAALEGLRVFDSKSRLAYALNTCGELALAEGRTERARSFAEEALTTAQAIRRASEVTRAKVLLARVLAATGDRAPARGALEPVLHYASSRDVVSAAVRSAIASAAAELDLAIQTLVQTPA
jgi:DNA-binding SARP family transcriptional activator